MALTFGHLVLAMFLASLLTHVSVLVLMGRGGDLTRGMHAAIAWLNETPGVMPKERFAQARPPRCGVPRRRSGMPLRMRPPLQRPAPPPPQRRRRARDPVALAAPLGVLARDSQESAMNAVATFSDADTGFPPALSRKQPMIVNTNTYNFK